MTPTRRTAVVTGAGSGIGRAVALAMLERDYNVVLAGRRQDRLDDTRAAAGDDAGRGLAVAADVSLAADVDRVFDRCIERFGRVDLLFNNAGINVPAAEIDELDVDAWRSVVDINVTGAFLCARRAYAEMKRQSPRGGRIINNGSVSAHVPRPNSIPYTVSKHAITGLTRSLALDGRRHDIACGQIDIGNAATERAARLGRGTLQADGGTRGEALMDVEHVVASVLHMAALPLAANVLFMTVMATGMPYVGRG